jgi:hypothetical protein
MSGAKLLRVFPGRVFMRQDVRFSLVIFKDQCYTYPRTGNPAGLQRIDHYGLMGLFPGIFGYNSALSTDDCSDSNLQVARRSLP